MLKGSIPPHIEPRKLADREAVLEGSFALKQFDRVCDQLEGESGEVSVRLEFGRDTQGIITMQGSLDVEVQMICQRCLEAAQIPVHGEFIYAIFREDATPENLPRGYDALEVGEDPLELHDLIEEELLLALPIVPAHAPEQCRHPAGYTAAPEPSVDEVSRSNPFGVLAQLKRDPNV